MRPTLLSRYVLQSLAAYLAACAGILVFVLSLVFFMRLFHFAAEKGIPLLWTFGAFGPLTPYLLSLTVPVAFLLAVLLTLGQLARTGEITALRASGFSPWQILRPLAATSLVLTAVLLGVNHDLGPRGLRAFRDSFREGLREVTRLDLEARSLTEVGPFWFFAEKVDRKARTFERALLYRQGGGAETVRVQAARGAWELLPRRGVELAFEEGELQLPNPDPGRLTLARFERYRVFAPFVRRGWSRVPTTRELPSRRLRERLRDPEVSGRLANEARAELAVRTATALAPVVFLLVAAPLAMRLGGRSKAPAFAWALGALFAYYGLTAWGITLGGRDEALSALSPWLADAVGLAFGGWLAWREFR